MIVTPTWETQDQHSWMMMALYMVSNRDGSSSSSSVVNSSQHVSSSSFMVSSTNEGVHWGGTSDCNVGTLLRGNRYNDILQWSGINIAKRWSATSGASSKLVPSKSQR